MIGFLGGRMRVSGARQCAEAILNILLAHEIPYDGLFVCEDAVSFWVPWRVEKHLFAVCDEAGICLTVEERRGLPRLIRRYGSRVGLIIGGLLAALTLFLASRVVWDVRVTGNLLLGDEVILEMLSECGLGNGTYLPALDTDLVESKLLLSHREISWVSINIKGTTANVEVLETVSGEEKSTAYANLIASAAGQIERIEAYDGNVCVKVGDVVRKGDLLVSGVYDRGVLGIRATHARGNIFARTVRDFDVEIPLKTTQKVYTGREWCEKYVKFFGKRIKVFANTGNVGAECDIIYRDNGITLPDGSVLPLGVETAVYREYRQEPLLLAGDAAMELAFERLSQVLERFVSETGAELLSKSVRYELDEEAYRIRCTVVCIENIAIVQEFDIN